MKDRIKSWYIQYYINIIMYNDALVCMEVRSIVKYTYVCSSIRYMCTYVCINVIHTYVDVTKSICEKMYIRSNAGLFMYLRSTPSPLSHYTYNITYVHNDIRTYIRISLSVYVYTYVYACVYRHTYVGMYVHVHIRMYVHACE